MSVRTAAHQATGSEPPALGAQRPGRVGPRAAVWRSACEAQPGRSRARKISAQRPQALLPANDETPRGATDSSVPAALISKELAAPASPHRTWTERGIDRRLGLVSIGSPFTSGATSPFDSFKTFFHQTAGSHDDDDSMAERCGIDQAPS